MRSKTVFNVDLSYNGINYSKKKTFGSPLLFFIDCILKNVFDQTLKSEVDTLCDRKHLHFKQRFHFC